MGTLVPIPPWDIEIVLKRIHPGDLFEKVVVPMVLWVDPTDIYRFAMLPAVFGVRPHSTVKALEPPGLEIEPFEGVTADSKR